MKIFIVSTIWEIYSKKSDYVLKVFIKTLLSPLFINIYKKDSHWWETSTEFCGLFNENNCFVLTTWKSNNFLKHGLLLDDYPKCFIVGADSVGSNQMHQIRITNPWKNSCFHEKIPWYVKQLKVRWKCCIGNNTTPYRSKSRICFHRWWSDWKQRQTYKVKASAQAGAIAPPPIMTSYNDPKKQVSFRPFLLGFLRELLK